MLSEFVTHSRGNVHISGCANPPCFNDTTTMISIGDAVALLNTFWTTYQSLKSNREECHRLYKHSRKILEYVEKECAASSSMPRGLERRLQKFVE